MESDFHIRNCLSFRPVSVFGHFLSPMFFRCGPANEKRAGSDRYSSPLSYWKERFFPALLYGVQGFEENHCLYKRTGLEKHSDPVLL